MFDCSSVKVTRQDHRRKRSRLHPQPSSAAVADAAATDDAVVQRRLVEDL